MSGEVKRMAEIPPLPINRNVLEPQNRQFGVTMSAFNEEKAYQVFLEEKAALRAYYAPLEQTHGISDFHCYTYWYVSKRNFDENP